LSVEGWTWVFQPTVSTCWRIFISAERNPWHTHTFLWDVHKTIYAYTMKRWNIGVGNGEFVVYVRIEIHAYGTFCLAVSVGDRL
jgi:hypothetical protein